MIDEINVVISCSPDAQIGEKYNLHIAPDRKYRMWEHPELIVLNGFASAFDAWIFCAAHFGICASHQNGCSAEWTYKNPKNEQQPQQMKLI